jgi:hypothetical protein
MVSPSLTLKPVVGFVVEPQNQGGGGFPGLDLKISSYGFSDLSLEITDGFLVWSSKPSRLQFVGCDTKSTEGGRRGTRVEI